MAASPRATRRIGVLAYRSKVQTLAQWQPLSTVLQQALPDREFVVEPLTYAEMNKAKHKGRNQCCLMDFPTVQAVDGQQLL